MPAWQVADTSIRANHSPPTLNKRLRKLKVKQSAKGRKNTQHSPNTGGTGEGGGDCD